MTALVSGEVPIFLPSIANVLSGLTAGAKLGCIAFPIKGVSRELVVRQDIDSLAALRGKTIGVQSIVGGFWLQTMMLLDAVGIDPDKIGMKMRVIGEEATIVQALVSGNVGLCCRNERIANSPELMTRLAGGMVDQRVKFRFLIQCRIRSPYCRTCSPTPVKSAHAVAIHDRRYH